jgi:hypothetical protein
MQKLKICAEVVFPVQVNIELDKWDSSLSLKDFEAMAITEAEMHFKNGAIAPVVANITVSKED